MSNGKRKVLTMQEEKWIDDVFESLEGIERAKPASELFSMITARLERPETKVIPLFWVRAAAVAAVVLISFNIYCLKSFSNEEVTGDAQTDVTSGYQLISSTYNLYD